MKKMFSILLLMGLFLSISANEVRYFTHSQAQRIALALDRESELMIYCGYENELSTYVIINEVWYEPVNSKYYEIWLYGFDAYTGEEIYMPIDLSCIWLYNYNGQRMYSAAQYLRFRTTVATPSFYWTMPPYNAFVRRYHDPDFRRMYTYHYEIHRVGWYPPYVKPGVPAPYPPYYMRTPSTPAPVPAKPYTPGVDFPKDNAGHSYIGATGRSVTNGGMRSTTSTNNGGLRSGTNSNNGGNLGTASRGEANPQNGSTSSRSSATNSSSQNTTPRSSTTNSSTTNSRSSVSNTNTSTTTRTSSTGTSSSSRQSTTNSATSSREAATQTGSSSSSSRQSGTNSGSSSRSSVTTNNTSSSSSRSNATTNTSSSSSRSSATTNSTTSSSRSSATNSSTSSSRSSSTNRSATSTSRSSSSNSGTSSSRSNTSTSSSSRSSSSNTPSTTKRSR